jgi:hypothetical protein
MNDNLMKSNVLPIEEINMLREKFISDYARKNGWNKDNLTPNQMLEIISHKNYKTPGLIYS